MTNRSYIVTASRRGFLGILLAAGGCAGPRVADKPIRETQDYDRPGSSSGRPVLHRRRNDDSDDPPGTR